MPRQIRSVDFMVFSRIRRHHIFAPWSIEAELVVSPRARRGRFRIYTYNVFGETTGSSQIIECAPTLCILPVVDQLYPDNPSNGLRHKAIK